LAPPSFDIPNLPRAGLHGVSKEFLETVAAGSHFYQVEPRHTSISNRIWTVIYAADKGQNTSPGSGETVSTSYAKDFMPVEPDEAFYFFVGTKGGQSHGKTSFWRFE